MIEKYLVKKITEPVDWKVTVPGSKSMTNRALLMAVLSAGTVRVEGVLFSDDSRHFLACLVALGFTAVSYTHLRAHETRHDLVCRLLLEKKKKNDDGTEAVSYIGGRISQDRPYGGRRLVLKFSDT